MVLALEVVLLQEGQEERCPTVRMRVADLTRRKESLDVVVILQSQPNLLQVVGAIDAIGGLTNLLHGGQQQRD